MSISLEQPPVNTDAELSGYLNRKFVDIAIELERASSPPVINVIPLKPSNGEIYYFGTIVGAITVKGFWGYEEGSWVKL